ncbi:response regulator [Oceanobacillus sp. Castelsardo]|uniref:response regulator n=1 Tax=Oceanobacillus sp. Castelsardo TaxID=1851204 RepID=UPI000839425E|nr:response regulator [Oceanobacillus sp. Castelsardo]
MINVLIIEDDPMVAKFNQIYVEKVTGFTTTGVVHDISAGWEFLNNHHVNLVLLDIYIANRNGLDLLSKIRNASLNVDVIVITAANDHESIQRALRYGAFDYLIKPYDFDRFKDALLKYQQKFERMVDGRHVQQEDLDVFLLNKYHTESSAINLPKGLTAPTMARIVRQISEWESNLFTIAEISDQTGISRVSISKYLKFLTGQDILKVEIRYQETGRPLHQYQLKPDKIQLIQTLMVEEEK